MAVEGVWRVVENVVKFIYVLGPLAFRPSLQHFYYEICKDHILYLYSNSQKNKREQNFQNVEKKWHEPNLHLQNILGPSVHNWQVIECHIWQRIRHEKGSIYCNYHQMVSWEGSLFCYVIFNTGFLSFALCKKYMSFDL